MIHRILDPAAVCLWQCSPCVCFGRSFPPNYYGPFFVHQEGMPFLVKRVSLFYLVLPPSPLLFVLSSYFNPHLSDSRFLHWRSLYPLFHFHWALRKCGVDAHQNIFHHPYFMEYPNSIVMSLLTLTLVPCVSLYSMFCLIFTLAKLSLAFCCRPNSPEISPVSLSIFFCYCLPVRPFFVCGVHTPSLCPIFGSLQQPGFCLPVLIPLLPFLFVVSLLHLFVPYSATSVYLDSLFPCSSCPTPPPR